MGKRNKYMKEAVEEMERLNADKELRYLYLMRLKAASDKATMDNYYKQLKEEAEKKALEEGRKNGLEEGWKSGLEEGIKALILDNLEDGRDRDVIIMKLKSRFGLTEEKAVSSLERYAHKG